MRHAFTHPGNLENVQWLERGNALFEQLKSNPSAPNTKSVQQQLSTIMNSNFQHAVVPAEQEAIRAWAVLLTKLATPPSLNTSETIATTVANARRSSVAVVTAAHPPRQHAKPRTQNQPARTKQPAMPSTINKKPDSIGPESYDAIDPDGLYESIISILSQRSPDITISQEQERSLRLLSNEFAAAKDSKDMRLTVQTVAAIVREGILPSTIGTLLITITGTTRDLPDDDRRVLHEAYIAAIDEPLANDEEIFDLDT